MFDKEKIKDINKEISEALSFLGGVFNMADTDEWAYFLNYSDEDLLNALYVFNHVAQNIAIKKGVITIENAEEKMTAFRLAIKEVFGFDAIELTNKVFGQPKKEEGNGK